MKDIQFVYANNVTQGSRSESISTAKESIRQVLQVW
ncbi:hypothetical protein [Dulcicalothrix desertica]